MAVTWVPFGPGTVTIGETGTELEFSCEVLGGGVGHEYEEVGESRTMLCGTERGATRKRLDSVKFSVENDLTTAGLYAFLQGLGENPADQAIEYTPNTAAGASWAGRVVPLLPADIAADEYGSPIASDVEWPAVGLLTFTPGTAAP